MAFNAGFLTINEAKTEYFPIAVDLISKLGVSSIYLGHTFTMGMLSTGTSDLIANDVFNVSEELLDPECTSREVWADIQGFQYSLPRRKWCGGVMNISSNRRFEYEESNVVVLLFLPLCGH
jgi:hypothetical protein